MYDTICYILQMMSLTGHESRSIGAQAQEHEASQGQGHDVRSSRKGFGGEDAAAHVTPSVLPRFTSL